MQTDNSLSIFDYYICLQLMKFSIHLLFGTYTEKSETK